MVTMKDAIKLETDYAKKYAIVGIQNALKEMMVLVDKVCRDNDIDYSIAYGTQIGAVRHGGFIPWDDDLDIIMFRKDFEKFKHVIEDSNPHGLKIVYSLWIERIILDDNYDLFIDIMILDNYPASKLSALFKGNLCRMFQGTLKENLDYQKYSPVYRVFLGFTGIVGKMLGKQTCLFLYNKAQQLGNNSYSEYVAAYNCGFKDVFKPFKRSWFNEFIDIPFEDVIFRSNSNYHELLTCYFGDYMTLPPEEERVPEHGRHDNA